MTKPARPKKPRPDNSDISLLLLTEALLDDFFDDPNQAAILETLSRGGNENEVQTGQAVILGSMDLSDSGTAKLTMHAGSPAIAVTMTHPRFTATISAHYDPNTVTMSKGRVAVFDGDRKQAANLADLWFEQLNTYGGGDGEDDDDFMDFLSGDHDGEGDGDPFEGEDDPGEPPPPSAADKAMVEASAKTLAREMKRKNPDLMAQDEHLVRLEVAPQTLWPILDGVVAACTAAKRDDHLIAAWCLLLESQLTLIRYRIDRGWHWAAAMAETFQRKLIEIGQTQSLSPADFLAIADAMGEAQIEIKPEIRAALADAGLPIPDDEKAADMPAMMRGLLDQMAETVSDPFDAASAIGDATRIMPAELRAFMTHEFALSPHAVLRDTVPLMLLSDEPQVRQTAAAALKQTAGPDTMSPETLRRMIAIRNWVPEADRPPIDLAIREARLKGVECAPWPQAQDLIVTASMIDGSGAQSILLTSGGKGKGVLAGLLLKLGAGVADSWCDPETTRRDIDNALSAMRGASACTEVTRAHLEEAVQHAIAAGVASGRPPGVGLPRIAELTGGADWRDRRLDVAAEAARLFGELPEASRWPLAIAGSLARSGTWIDAGFAESWFFDDAETRAIVKRGPRNGAAARLMTEALPKRRAEWAERFLLLGLRAKAAKDRQHKNRADDFIVLAHALSGDTDPAEIPLMAAIVRYTVEVSKRARW